MSPARIGWPVDGSGVRSRSQAKICRAIAWARRVSPRSLVSCSSGSCQPSARVGRLDLDQGPDLDQAGVGGLEAVVRRPAVSADHAVARLGLGKHRIDQIEDRLGRAEGPAERLFAPRLPAAARTGFECLPEPTIARHVGALHAHDRLLLVADHEQRAPHLPRACADEELRTAPR